MNLWSLAAAEGFRLCLAPGCPAEGRVWPEILLGPPWLSCVPSWGTSLHSGQRHLIGWHLAEPKRKDGGDLNSKIAIGERKEVTFYD